MIWVWNDCPEMAMKIETTTQPYDKQHAQGYKHDFLKQMNLYCTFYGLYSDMTKQQHSSFHYLLIRKNVLRNGAGKQLQVLFLKHLIYVLGQLTNNNIFIMRERERDYVFNRGV